MALRPSGLWIRLAAVSITLILMAAAAEVAARVIYAFEDEIKAALGVVDPPRDLNVFERADPDNPGNWLLKPDVAMTLEQIVRSKVSGGRSLGVKRLEEAGRRLGVSPEEIVFRTNAQGYKGPTELDVSGKLLRILSIGDSCTFGTELDWWSYPRAFERALVRLGVAAEVVNVGVGGYGPSNVKHRLAEFEALRPAWTTVYIGWNALFGEEHLHGATRWLHSMRVVESVRARTSGRIDPRAQALAAYNLPKRPEPEALSEGWLRNYVPTFFQDVVHIVDAMTGAGSKVVIITLPGLYSTRERPSERALGIGHLPSTTDNPYVLAAMSERYNEELRRLSESRRLPLVDLERWADENLLPRDAYFTDSVHLTEEGQAMIGAYLADQLYLLVSRPPDAP